MCLCYRSLSLLLGHLRLEHDSFTVAGTSTLSGEPAPEARCMIDGGMYGALAVAVTSVEACSTGALVTLNAKM